MSYYDNGESDMLNEVLSNLIGNAIVASGRAIKVHNIEMYTKNGFEITPEQYLVLNMLKKESYSQARLCELLMKDKSNMARIISEFVFGLLLFLY